MSNADDLLKRTLFMRKLNEENRINLHKLGVDLNDLSHGTQSTIKEFVDIQKKIGLHDLDIINLEIWYLNKKVEMHELERDLLKPLQGKIRDVNIENEKEQQKVMELRKSIAHFKSTVISEHNVKLETEKLWKAITDVQKKINDLPKPPAELDIDELVNKIQISKTK